MTGGPPCLMTRGMTCGRLAAIGCLMLSVEADIDEIWHQLPVNDPEAAWETLAASACRAALAASAFAYLIEGGTIISVSVVFADDAMVHDLNARFRGKDQPTNVLSFPMVQADLLPIMASENNGELLLGDIILAHGVCTRESADKGIALADHAAHLVVHGMLHLLGHDHLDDPTAEAMEALEIKALASLGLADPYGDRAA